MLLLEHVFKIQDKKNKLFLVLLTLFINNLALKDFIKQFYWSKHEVYFLPLVAKTIVSGLPGFK